MKKNKIITLILALAVCSSLILSLCSFTTGLGQQGDVEQYSTPYKVDIKYCYHRVTTTLDEEYYGYFKQFNNIVAGIDGKTYARASDYHVISNTTFNYTNVTRLSDGRYSFGLISEDVDVAYFTGDVEFSDFCLSYYKLYEHETFLNDKISFVGSASDNIHVYVDWYYITASGDFISDSYYTYVPVSMFADANNGDAVILQDLFKLVYDDIINNNDYVTNSGDLYIKSLRLSYTGEPYENVIFTASTYSTLQMTGFEDFLSDWGDIYMNIFDEGYTSGITDGTEIGFEDGYDYGYDEGLEVGFNQGVSQAPGIWGGLGTFLSTTVGAFLEFEFFSGFTVANVLSLIVSVGVVLIFLKIFAGG